MKLTPGKVAGLKAVSDERGVIAAAAIDQRGSLLQSLTKEKGADAGRNDLEEFKVLVTKVLTRHASAVLLDPEYGLPAAAQRNGKGLLLAYEKTGYDAKTTGRLPDLLDLWSVRRLKEVGADRRLRTPPSITSSRHGSNALATSVSLTTFLFFWNASGTT
jgi:tagatose 1,6-diphosphate aldolase